MEAPDLNANEGWLSIHAYEGILRSGPQDGGIGSSHGPPPVRVPSHSGRGTSACACLIAVQDPRLMVSLRPLVAVASLPCLVSMVLHLGHPADPRDVVHVFVARRQLCAQTTSQQMMRSSRSSLGTL
jgi:hypothetical protein